MFIIYSFSLSAKMTSAFHFGGSATQRMTVGIAQMSPQTAVSDQPASGRLLLIFLLMFQECCVVTMCCACCSRQLSLNANPVSSSAAPASASTLPTSVTETTTVRTALTKPTAVETLAHAQLLIYTTRCSRASLSQTFTFACRVSSSVPTPTAASQESSAATARTTAGMERMKRTAVSHLWCSLVSAPRNGGRGFYSFHCSCYCCSIVPQCVIVFPTTITYR